MSRKTNGFVGTFSTSSDLETKYPAVDHVGCSANVGTTEPFSKYWSDGVSWAGFNSTEIVATQALVSEAWKSATSVAEPYRLGFLGDSRTSLLSTTQIGGAGSGVSTSGIRIPHWVCAYLHDSQYVAAFGVPGDTLVSASTSTGWDGVARVNSKTLTNLLAVGVDGVYISTASMICRAQRLLP